jgi:hypothetical protein
MLRMRGGEPQLWLACSLVERGAVWRGRHGVWLTEGSGGGAWSTLGASHSGI